MKPYEQFKKNVEAPSLYLGMYRELRKLKQLGSRGKLSEENRYLMWLPRAMIVSSLSALDAYVHQILYEKIPKILGQHGQVPSRLAELIVAVNPMKKASDVHDAIKFISSKNGPEALSRTAQEK